MFAIGLYDYGGPDVLQSVEQPDPHPLSGQVRVKVRAAGINPVDVMVRDGSLAEWFADAEPPFVPGMDISGIIDELGEGISPASGIAIGQNVVGVVNNFGGYGGYSQYVCLPLESVTHLPDGVSLPDGAAFLMTALTARHALDTLHLPQDSVVLVTGAAGAVGAYAVALGNVENLHIVAIASPQDETFLRELGASEFISREDNLNTRIREKYPEGVCAVIDAANIGEQIAHALQDNGTIINLRPKDPASLERGIKQIFVNVRERIADQEAITRLSLQVADGLLPVRVAKTFHASEAVSAHRLFEKGGLRGRIILDFDEK